MVSILVDSTTLELQLAPAERLLALRKEPVRVARQAIQKVQLTDDPFTWLRGVRAPGTHVPGRLAYGTWKSVFGDDFAVIRSGRPGVVIDLDQSADFGRLIVTTQHGADLVAALHADDAA